jgi:hypothetical protein
MKRTKNPEELILIDERDPISSQLPYQLQLKN